MRISDCRIVGAMVAPQGKAAFDRANVVVESRSDAGMYLQVRAYIGPDEIEGKPLVREEWEALLRSGQATAIASVDAVSGGVLWVLRPGFEGVEAALEDLRTSGVLLRDVIRLTGGSFGCLVREPAANAFRDRWAEAASKDAMSRAKSGRWERARDAASRAFVLERAMTPERIAMLSLAHMRCGNVTAAEGYLEMARRSRGDDFATRIVEQRDDLERETQQDAPASGLRCAEKIRTANDNAMRAGLRRVASR